ncbi:HIRAN domain-containing protein [Nocardioides sp.]|uniref:HIRAN domain-containing protein n=1 Tax=Nocardioides sp. TaxID=35761 RepID=UPI0039E46A28
MEFLARSGGRRAGDTIELLQTPNLTDDGHTECVFLVHGIRYNEGASDEIEHLSTGQELRLLTEPENPADPRAVLVTTDDTRLGWVPSPLLDYVHTVMGAGECRLTVVRANPPEVGHHMRLLVRLEGCVPEGYLPAWQIASSRGPGRRRQSWRSRRRTGSPPGGSPRG